MRSLPGRFVVAIAISSGVFGASLSSHEVGRPSLRVRVAAQLSTLSQGAAPCSANLRKAPDFTTKYYSVHACAEGRRSPESSVPGEARMPQVACGSAGNCAAGGWFSSAGSYTEQAFVAVEVNGVWANAIEVPGIAALSAGATAFRSEEHTSELQSLRH